MCFEFCEKLCVLLWHFLLPDWKRAACRRKPSTNLEGKFPGKNKVICAGISGNSRFSVPHWWLALWFNVHYLNKNLHHFWLISRLTIYWMCDYAAGCINKLQIVAVLCCLDFLVLKWRQAPANLSAHQIMYFKKLLRVMELYQKAPLGDLSLVNMFVTCYHDLLANKASTVCTAVLSLFSCSNLLRFNAFIYGD